MAEIVSGMKERGRHRYLHVRGNFHTTLKLFDLVEVGEVIVYLRKVPIIKEFSGSPRMEQASAPPTQRSGHLFLTSVYSILLAFCGYLGPEANDVIRTSRTTCALRKIFGYCTITSGYHIVHD